MKVKLGNYQSVENLKEKNQFIIKTDCGEIFKSYKSNIVAKINGKIYLDEKYWNWSATTGRYRNIFLGETKKETEKKIKSGIYELVNLN